jgi:hypothetical protein
MAGAKPGPNVSIAGVQYYQGEEGEGGTGDPTHYDEGHGATGHGGGYESLDP